MLIDEEFIELEDSEIFYCPNCDAILSEQVGFDQNIGVWNCLKCGQLLMDEDLYDGDNFNGVLWYCDNCKELLNKQPGFSDSYGSWICSKCGYRNDITEDNIIS